MALNEADTRAKLIDPNLHRAGWSEDHIKREVTAGATEIVNGVARKRGSGRMDYLLRLKTGQLTQPVAIALIEAKAEHLPPTHGLQQGKIYASVNRLNIPFVFSSNGHQFVEYDNFTGLTQAPKSMLEFPSPEELQKRYEDGKGFTLDSEFAKPLITTYSKGEGGRRYYQDAAIRAVFEKIATGKNRALLSLATGAGKTYIAVNILKRIADAGQLKRALFLCDRDELRSQGLGAFSNEFGNDAGAVSTKDPQKNSRVLIATYQTLGVDTEDGDSSFLHKNYPKNYFSHIIIDECHRSAWGKWSEILKLNPDAIQIGLTATPREFAYADNSEASDIDQKITSDNLKYFGDPVYEYSIGQGIDDGYLAAMQITRANTFINRSADTEQQTGLRKIDIEGSKITDALTGEQVTKEELSDEYTASSFEARILMPDRVKLWCQNLFDYLCMTGKAEQKTIIFCVRDRHADDVANELNNIYAKWCAKNNKTPVDDYAFKCTAESGKEYLADIRGSTRHHFIATTVDLLTTGVDVPPVVNIVFFKYVNSPISFYQMVGRGTRLHAPTNKLMFNVYDYTNATRLFGEDFITKIAVPRGPKTSTGDNGGGEKEQSYIVEDIEIRITDAGKYILTTDEEGNTLPVTLEEYKSKLSETLLEDIPSLDEFRKVWVEPEKRSEMIGNLPDSGRSPLVIQSMNEMKNYDLFDVIGEIGYGLNPKTMNERAQAFEYKNITWLDSINKNSADVIKAIAGQFAKGGTDDLENPMIFKTPEVSKAGGVPALGKIGDPQMVLKDTKLRMFTA